MPQQKGLAPIYLVLLIAAIIAALVYIVLSQGILKLPFRGKAEEPIFNIKTEYQNPFRSTNQDEGYVNPFENLK